MTPEVRFAVDQIIKQFPQQQIVVAEDQTGGACVIVDGEPLGPPYDQADTWIGFHITDQCPYACAGKARSRGTRCRDVIFETLFETLWVSNPIRPRSAASRNRVMRGPGVTQGAKRSQGARRLRD